MRATSGRLASARQSTSLPVFANAFVGNAFNHPFQPSHCHRNRSTGCHKRWPQAATTSYSMLSRVVCSASHSPHGVTHDAQRHDYCGVTLSRAVYEIIESATEDRKMMDGSVNIADAVCLMLASLKHHDCNSLRQRLELSGIHFDELEAVLTVGLAVQQEQHASTAASSSNQNHNDAGSLMQQFVLAAMQHAASKGSNVVQVKDLLYSLTSNRDVICLTSNPLYYAVNHMFGPVASDKVMEEWFELLSTTTLVTSTKDCVLPAHIPDAANRLTHKAIHEAKSAAGIADLLTAYTTLGWVPSVSVSTQLWELLVKTSSRSYAESDVAVRLLAGLATLPIPPTLKSIRMQLAATLDKLILRSVCASDGDDFPSFSSISWNVLFNALACCARLEEAFPGTVAEDQLAQKHNTALTMVKQQAVNASKCNVLKVILNNMESRPAEAYLALTYLHWLQPLSNNPTPSCMLQAALSYTTSTARAAFHSKMFAFQPWQMNVCWQERFRDHLSADLQQQPVANRLPYTVWSSMLVWKMETTGWHPIRTAQLLQEIYKYWGGVWQGSSAELLTARLKAHLNSKQCGNQPYLNAPQKRWLWEDVLNTLATSRNANSIKTLMEHAKALELPVNETTAHTSRALQQALENVELDQSDLSSYLSTLPQFAQCASKARNHQPSHTAQEELPLAVIHSHVAGRINARKSVCSTTGDAGKPKSDGSHTLGVLTRLLSEKDIKRALQLAVEAVENDQISRLKAIAWLCMKFNNATMNESSMEQLAEQLEVAMNMLMMQQGGTGNLQGTTPAILQRWAALTKQQLSLAVQRRSSSDSSLSAVPKLTTALSPLIRLGQTDLWLGDLPCRILTDICNKSFDQQTKLLWARFVWSLSAAWWLDASLSKMETCSAQLTCLKDVLATAGDGQPVVQTSLMMTAAACSFQQQLAKTDATLPPIINQLFSATSRAAVLSIAKLEASKLKEASDDDLLYLSDLVVRLCSGHLPSEISRDKLNVGLRALSNEMERRQAAAPPATPQPPPASYVGRQVELLINPRAPHPVTAFLDFTPEGHVFRAEIVKYIADADKYEVRFWPVQEGPEKYEQVNSGVVQDNLVPKERELSREELRNSTTATSAIGTRYNNVHMHNMSKPLTTTSQWAAVARAIKARL